MINNKSKSKEISGNFRRKYRVRCLQIRVGNVCRKSSRDLESDRKLRISGLVSPSRFQRARCVPVSKTSVESRCVFPRASCRLVRSSRRPDDGSLADKPRPKVARASEASSIHGHSCLHSPSPLSSLSPHARLFAVITHSTN